MSGKLWGGCFTQGPNQALTNLNNSLPIDKRLYREDIVGSKAYAKALHQVGLLTTAELLEIQTGLDKVLSEWQSGVIKFAATDEDVHTVNERRLTELIGKTGGKLHTGRSRNDQVVTDMRMWMKDATKDVIDTLCRVLVVMIERSNELITVIMPGYTHLQRAQPIRFSHWLLHHATALKADLSRFSDASQRINELPLGSGAIAGNPFGIDRQKLAADLGFMNVTENSMHAVSDRDFVVEFNFNASLTAIHLSRLAEDLILYATKEFGFIEIADEYSTGSSLMPQKRNPDSLELVRGISGEIFGQLSGLMMSLKGLPSTYNKDLQSDKQSMFISFDKIKSSLEIVAGVVSTMKVNSEKCLNALTYDMLATDLAYYLVRKGLPFRDAHHISGNVIVFASQNSIQLNELSLKELQKISKLFEKDIFEIWNFTKSVEQYTVIGGTSEASVKEQIEKLEIFLNSFEVNKIENVSRIE